MGEVLRLRGYHASDAQLPEVCEVVRSTSEYLPGKTHDVSAGSCGQDRLTKKMRLAGVENKDGVNEFLERYLPEHNEQFSRPSAREGDLHREPPSHEELLRALCIKEERRVRDDGVVQHKNRWYQLEGVSRRVKRVIVEERTDGSVKIRKNGSYLKYRQIPPQLILKAKTRRKEKKIQRRPKPSKDHPWRKFKIKPHGETYAERGDISILLQRVLLFWYNAATPGSSVSRRDQGNRRELRYILALCVA